jgi:arylsulfatase A-like enzyme
VKNLDLSEHQKRSLLFSRNDEMGYLYDDLVHIPLIFSGYKIPQKEIFEQVRHTDVFPTLFELADLPMTLENIQGRSLVPLLEDKSIEEQPVYMEGRFRIDKDESLSVIGIRTSTYKYFRGRKKTSNNVFLFNLKNDPLEEINLANKNPEIIEEMEKTLISINENNFNQIKTTKLTEDEKNKVELELRRLGYI